MNWELFAVTVVFLFLMLSLSFAAVAYIRHRAKRRNGMVEAAGFTEGVFFKRYIPPGLRVRYDEEKVVPVGGPLSRLGKLTTASAIAGVAAVSIGSVVISLYLHKDKYLPRIELTDQELSALDHSVAHIVHDADAIHPGLVELQPRLQELTWVMLSDKPRTGDIVSVSAISDWTAFFSRLELSSEQCGWGELKKCVKKPSDSVIVVLPGEWEFAKLESLLAQGARILLYGAPDQLREDTALIEWQGMKFELTDFVDKPQLALVADEKLTLGFDAGLILEVDSVRKDFRVSTSRPQAIAIAPDQYFGSGDNTRLYSPDLDSGRLVWMDFSPDAIESVSDTSRRNLDQLLASIFRYLAGVEYSDIALWPQGKKFAAFLEARVPRRFGKAGEIVDRFEARAFPLSWYVSKEFAMEHRDLVRRMASLGEVGCLSEIPAELPVLSFDNYLRRMAHCRKVLETISGATIVGFRAGSRVRDEAMINASMNIGMIHYNGAAKHAFGGLEIEESVSQDKSIVSIPRIQIPVPHASAKSGLSEGEAKWVLQSEIDLFKTVGALFSLSIGANEEDLHTALNDAVYAAEKLQGDDCFLATTEQIGRWWKYRNELRHRRAPSEDLSHVFFPVELRVDDKGKLIRRVYSSDAGSSDRQ